jgi:hypothetical protein
MKQTLLLLCAAALVSGCSSYYPPRTTSMYDNYGFTYDYSASPVPAAVDVPAIAETTPAPTFLVQVPPPTVIYQTTEAAVHSSIDTNTPTNVSTSDEANPYKGSYLIPPKVVVVPQQTIIREAAGSATGVVGTNAAPAAGPQYYPAGGSYVYPYGVGFGTVGTNTNNVVVTNLPGISNSVVITNGISNNVVVTNGISNNVVVTNGGISNNVVITNGVTVTNQNIASATNRIVEAAGAQATNPPPFAPRPATNAVSPISPAPALQSPSTFQRPNSQSTTGSGTGQPAQSMSGGSFAPPPPGTTPLPGSQTAPRR